MSKPREQKSIGKAFLSSPLAVVLTVATVVVFGMSFAGYVRRGGFWSPEVEARVFNAAGRAGNEASGTNRDKRRRFAFQGEVYDQAEQLRESAALAMAATLVATQRVLERRSFETVDSLITGIVEQGLLPPGLEQAKGNRSASSRHGTYYIRYRTDPLGVEVLSISKGIGEGVAIIVRLPDDEFSENALTYYTISKAGLQAPGAFTPVAQLIGSGWRPEPFRAAELSPAEKEQQRQWVSTRTASAK